MRHSSSFFKIITPIALLPILLFGSAGFAELTAPLIVTSNPGMFESRIVPELSRVSNCAALFSPDLSKSRWSDVSNVIKSANKSFERRGWSEEFLKERLKLAWDFRERSEYFYLNRQTDSYVATLGLTWAQYTSQSQFDSNLAVTRRDLPHVLPGELSLHSKPFPRPLSSNGEGIIFELRSWAIDKERLDAAQRSEAFSSLLAELLPAIFQRIKNYPELYDQPILYTYADEVSLKLYGIMGFQNLSIEPIEHEGSKWWIMAISPKALEAFTIRLKSPQVLMKLNQVFQVTSPQGRFSITGKDESGHPGAALISGHALRGAGLSQVIHYLAQDTDVAPGITAAAGSHVLWDLNGQIKSVTALAKKYEIEPGIVADQFSGLLFDQLYPSSNLRLYRNQFYVDAPNAEEIKNASSQPYIGVTIIDQEVEIKSGIVAAKGSALAWTNDRSTILVGKLAQPATLSGENWTATAAAGASIEITPSRVYISHLAYRVQLPNEKLIAAGSPLTLFKKSKLK